MKKIKAFIIASCIFLAIVMMLHLVIMKNGIKTDNPGFGTWYNQYKDLSYNAVSQNLTKDEMFVFGSSEFRHGRKTPYHPANFFADTNVKLMTIGGPFNQTLFHAIALGAFEPDIKNRKVVLLVSPSWFKSKSVSDKAYSLRFSETEYIAFLENKNIPKDIKDHVARRSVSLLDSSPGKQSHVRLYNRVLLGMGKMHPTDKLVFKALKSYESDKDTLTTKAAMYFLRDKDLAYTNKVTPNNKNVSQWGMWASQAKKTAEKSSHNPFYISDKSWKFKYKGLYGKFKNRWKHKDLTKSKEFEDLTTFLEVARATHLKVCLVELPLNGYWYDYAGINAHKRAAFNRKLSRLAGDYGAEIVNMNKYDYTPYINHDLVHPWGEGWVRINEALYNFYNK